MCVGVCEPRNAGKVMEVQFEMKGPRPECSPDFLPLQAHTLSPRVSDTAQIAILPSFVYPWICLYTSHPTGARFPFPLLHPNPPRDTHNVFYLVSTIVFPVSPLLQVNCESLLFETFHSNTCTSSRFSVAMATMFNDSLFVVHWGRSGGRADHWD